MNWMGGFSSPEGAYDLAANAGIPIIPIVSGGKIVRFQMEHIWVEAAIDFEPSRGAVNKAADAWVSLDPSFKQYQEEVGYDMRTQLSFDGDAFFYEYLTHTENLTPYQYYSRKVLDHLNTSQPDWTLIGLYGHERIRQERYVTNRDLKLLAASLPYTTRLVGYTAHQVPEALRHRITFGVTNNPESGLDAQLSISLPELGYKRITWSYIPESAADDAVVEDYGSLYGSPAYLVRVKPQLRVDGQVVATGAGAGLGEQQTYYVHLQMPTLHGAPVIKKAYVGAYTAIVVQNMDAAGDAPNVSMAQLRTNAGLNEQGLAILDDTFGQLLHSIGKLWIHDIQYERNFYATTLHAPYHQVATELMVSGGISVSYLFGIPKQARRLGYQVDAHIDVMATSARDNNPRRKRDFMLLAGLTGSIWEGLELKGVFGGPDISAVKIIKIAAARGIPIHQITAANIDQILPGLSLYPEDVADIQHAVAAGRTATVPRENIAIGSWTGTGVIMLDETGSGPYLVSGGLAGGFACKTTGDPSGLCTESKWKEIISTKSKYAKAARELIVAYARYFNGTLYRLGCKDPVTRVPSGAVCADERSPSGIRIDCSGLVASVYYRVGYSYLVGKHRNEICCTYFYNAQSQWDYISTSPSGTTDVPIEKLKIGDIIAWKGTWTPNNKDPVERVDHVGIVTKVGPSLQDVKWVAAEGGNIDLVGEFAFSDFGQYRIDKLHGFASLFLDQIE